MEACCKQHLCLSKEASQQATGVIYGKQRNIFYLKQALVPGEQLQQEVVSAQVMRPVIMSAAIFARKNGMSIWEKSMGTPRDRCSANCSANTPQSQPFCCSGTSFGYLHKHGQLSATPSLDTPDDLLLLSSSEEGFAVRTLNMAEIYLLLSTSVLRRHVISSLFSAHRECGNASQRISDFPEYTCALSQPAV